MIKIFLDSGDIEEINELSKNPLIQGFTTNPSLMKKAGITDYEEFGRKIVEITDKPVSFEVFADEFDEMERQAKIISSWGENVFVKIPITNTQGTGSALLINKLTKEIQLNITAIFGLIAANEIIPELPMILSIFAGRIADTGRDPALFFNRAVKAEYLWASTREVFNIFQAEEAGADIITVSPDIFRKYETMRNKNLQEFSLETVKQFYDDAQSSGFVL